MTPTETAIRGYLLTMAALSARRLGPEPGSHDYTSIADFVLDRGTFDVSRSLSDEQAEYVAHATRGTRARYKECFSNAQALAMRHERLTYREGYAAGNACIPVLHGWCVLDGTHVVDLTWRYETEGGACRRVRGTFPETWAYLGTSPTRNEDIWPRVRRLRSWMSFIDCMEEGFPLLREPRLQPPQYGGILDMLRTG